MVALTLRGLVAASLLALLQCSRSLLVTATKKSDTSYSDSPEEVLLVQEVMKLFLALVLYGLATFTPSTGASASKTSKTRGTIGVQMACVLYLVPALCYAAQNLIVFYALLYIDPPTFQLFTQLKIVTTAVVFVVFQGNHLSFQQDLAVVLLLVASALGQWEDLRLDLSAPSNATIGFTLSLAYCVLSTLSGAVRETLLKHSVPSMAVQQVIMYTWSVVVNITICAIFHPGQWTAFLVFTPMTWVVVMNGAVLGHITGAVAKYANNLISAFAAATSLFLSAGLSVWFFDTHLHVTFFFGVLLTVASIFLYLQGETRPATKDA